MNETNHYKPSEKQRKCCYAHPYFGQKHNETHCVKDGWDDDKVKTVSNNDCENCNAYESRYIEYPLTINKIINKLIKINTTGLGHETGDLVEITPCGEEYNNKSYLGIYLGELPLQIISSFNKNTKELTNDCMNNPAIFVPELKKIIYGCESYWRGIEDIKDFKGITQEEIKNVWYIQALQALYPQTVDKSVENKIKIEYDYHLIVPTSNTTHEKINVDDEISEICIKTKSGTKTYQNVMIIDITKRQIEFKTKDDNEYIDVNINDIESIKK